jgi:hypothetical protein
MHWANYLRNVVQHYQVVIKGWPANIPFINLSQALSALPDLEMIHQKWKSRAICSHNSVNTCHVKWPTEVEILRAHSVTFPRV